METDRHIETKTFTIIGGRGHGKQIRQEDDFYATSPILAHVLCNYLKNENVELANVCLEPACGMGHLSEEFKKYYSRVVSTDLIDRGYGTVGIDFLRTSDFGIYEPFDILTNPPYKFSTEFILHSLDLLQPGRICAMYLKLTALEGTNRYLNVFKNNPPWKVLVTPCRFGCGKDGKFDRTDKYGFPTTGTAIAFAWFIWRKDFGNKKTEVDWFYFNDQELTIPTQEKN